MRVVLDARLKSGVAGGIQQVILGIATGLASLNEDRDDYMFLVVNKHDDWIRHHLRGRCRPVFVREPSDPNLWQRVERRVHRWRRHDASSPGEYLDIDRSIERSGAEVAHLLRQDAMLTSIPTIYHPHDLQHLHFPQFFSDEERVARERLYSTHCAAARFIVMMTTWAKDDLCARLEVPRSKVAVIPWPPFVRLLESPNVQRVSEIRRRYRLPERFALFPAQMWPHKNHSTLFRALAFLRDYRALEVPVVCCGTHTPFFAEIRRWITNLNLDNQVRFLGWVEDDNLYALYSSAHCLLFPSKFEGWGMPVTDAFEVGIPVACTDAPWLPDVMRGAVVTFDPSDPEAIAEAIEKVWTDDEIRSRLIQEGARRARSLNWRTVAATCRAMYRSAASVELSHTDGRLLADAGVEL